MTHKENHNPSCIICGALTYYVNEEGDHYCHNHLQNQPHEVEYFTEILNPNIVRLSLAKYQEHLHTYNGDPDYDTWETIGYYWDLNIYASDSGVLCATLCPVDAGGNTITDRPYPLIVDPTTAITYPYIVQVED